MLATVLASVRQREETDLLEEDKFSSDGQQKGIGRQSTVPGVRRPGCPGCWGAERCFHTAQREVLGGPDRRWHPGLLDTPESSWGQVPMAEGVGDTEQIEGWFSCGSWVTVETLRRCDASVGPWGLLLTPSAAHLLERD